MVLRESMYVLHMILFSQTAIDTNTAQARSLRRTRLSLDVWEFSAKRN